MDREYSRISQFLDRLSLFYETTPPNRQQVHELIAMGALVFEKPKTIQKVNLLR